jgi:hypothetical protein
MFRTLQHAADRADCWASSMELEYSRIRATAQLEHMAASITTEANNDWPECMRKNVQLMILQSECVQVATEWAAISRVCTERRQDLVRAIAAVLKYSLG